MKKTKFMMTKVSAAIATASLVFSGAINAQVTLEEIIVTAKAYEEDLQDVPLSISVLTANELEERGVADVRDLAQFTPNFNIYSGSGRQDTSAINVRGLSPNTSDERYQPVSFFLDGIFMGGIPVGLQTNDVERVEVIKGPQSASFGRATYAGAIDFITTTPSLDEFSASINLDVSTFHNSSASNLNHDLSVSVAGPIVEDKLSASIFVVKKLDDGLSAASGATLPEVGEEDTTSVNAVLFGQISDRTTIKIRGIFTEETDQEGLAYATQPLYWQQQGANIVTLPNGTLWIDGEVPDPLNEGVRGTDVPNPAIASPAGGGFERERTFISAIIEHEFESGSTLSYRGSYMENSYESNGDFRSRTAVGIDPIFGPVQPLRPGESSFNFSFPFPFQEEFEETSHQLRYLSPIQDEFRWSVGAYFYDSRDSNFRVRSDRTAPAGNPAYQTRGDEHIINKAIFGSVAYDVNNQLTLSFEGRFQNEDVEFDQLLSAVSTNAVPDRDLSESESSFEPRVTVDYKPNDDQLFYALYSKGVKSGRFNTSSVAPAPATGVARPAASFIYAPPEELQNYEIGSKTTFMDGRARFNAAVFFQDVKDQQLRQTVTIDQDFDGDGQNDIVNSVFTAGDSEIFGFELDGAFQATEKLLLTAAIGYADHEFVDDIPPNADTALFAYDLANGGTGTLKGKTSVNVPKLTGNFSATYTAPVSLLGMDMQWSTRGDLIYTGAKYVELANLAEIPAATVMNARSTFSGDDWKLSLYINNLFEDETALGAGLTGTSTCEFETNGPNLPAFIDGPGSVNDQRCIFLSPNRGREVGMAVTFDF